MATARSEHLARSDSQWPPFRRVLAVNEPGRSNAAVLDLARRLVERDDVALTVVSVAPQAPPTGGCAGSALPYNRAVCDTVAAELDQAHESLGEAAAHTTFQMLVEGADPPLDEWCEQGAFDLILLPARRRPLRSTKHPRAARLMRTGAEVRVVRP